MSDLGSSVPRTDSDRFRRAKRLLRFMPRRAVLHRYPLVGRFAHRIRTKSYLWSFRRKDTWKAYYVGSILSLLPLMGVQLPLGLAASLLFRTNFMVVGGLQFLTNPLTAGPVYYGTYLVGDAVLSRFRGGMSKSNPEPTEAELAEAGGMAAGEILDPLTASESPKPKSWSNRAAGVVDALIVGGTLAGSVLGLILDLSDRLLRVRAAKTARDKRRTALSTQ